MATARRAAGAAWEFHERTKHSLESVRRGPHTLDWANMPRPFKVYPELEPIPLPTELASSPRAALDAIRAEPGAARAGGGDRIDRASLAHLLHFAAGVVRRRSSPVGDLFYRAAACTGNLHHIDLYAVCSELPDLAAGVYHFSPHDHSLRRLREGDLRAVVVDAAAGQADLAAAPVALVFATTFWRNAWKYGTRAYRHAFWDSGTILANLLAVAAARDLPARIVLGFADASIEQLVGLDPMREAALGLVALGTGAETPPPAEPLEPLRLATLPLSRREIDDPSIRKAHAAGALDAPADVRAWRAGRPSAPDPASRGDEIALPAPPRAPAESIEQVILRRGSARRFAPTAIPLEALAATLHAATRGIACDVLVDGTSPSTVHVIANAVDGIAPGTYAYARERHALVPLAGGDFRREAAYLALGQDLGGDAAADLYWLTDLAPVLDALGDRGYRVAQLEAAVGGGRAYLAAYALGFAATGLTFFDDDVTRFFSPEAAGRSVMFLTAIGRPPARARSRAPHG